MCAARSPRPSLDQCVTTIEEILEAAASRSPKPKRALSGNPLARHALWICSCVTFDEEIAPNWLIYDTADDGLVWCRVPDSVEPLDLVDSQQSAGGHTHPESVLLWLQGKDPGTWATADGGGEAVVQELGRRIRGT